MRSLFSIKSDTSGRCFAAILALLFLIGLELACFLPIIKHVGFYLDDWVMLNKLSQGPSDFGKLLEHYFANDPRVIKRPVEAVLYMIQFQLFGMKPLGYHIVICAMEVAASWLLYLCIVSLSKIRSLALAIAALFLIYPSHNSTHYWVLCSVVGLSLLFYLGMLLANIRGASSGSIGLHVLSGFMFFLLLLNYEVFLPLVAVNVMLVYLIARPSRGKKQAILLSIAVSCIYGAALVLDFVYVYLIAPKLGIAWIHQISFDPSLICKTLFQGIKLNLPWVSFPFFAEAATMKWRDGFSVFDWAMLSLASLAFVSSILIIDRLGEPKGESGGTGKDKQDSTLPAFFKIGGEVGVASWILLLGLVTVVLSYSIFGLNQSYMPTFHSIVNRVNTGATIGLAFIFTSILMYLRIFLRNQNSFRMTLILSCLPLVLFFVITNYSLAKPYILSWQLQSHISKSLVSKRDALKDTRTVLLLNVPRYVNEAPVFDGVWDFQSMMRVLLSRQDIKGSVPCGRFRFFKDGVQDAPGGLILGAYTFDRLMVLISPECELVKVDNVEKLIDLIEMRGMQFELEKDLPEKWRKQIADSKYGKFTEEVDTMIEKTYD